MFGLYFIFTLRLNLLFTAQNNNNNMIKVAIATKHLFLKLAFIRCRFVTKYLTQTYLKPRYLLA